ncbi:MAG: HlyD family secretion protein [Bacteroidetes bacterium]|nr:MAG: HlyD family secretion protein [Bacteroidota bacterium]RLD80519.1 MAG: HlyD family secretion protein [Bacteroidota bacterium]
MKKIFWILILSAGIIACRNNDDKADAYGNFEATEVMVSAMAQGEIFSLVIEEGQELKAGEIIGLIDTTELFLKEEQLIKGIEAVRTRLLTIKAQMDVQIQQKKNLVVNQKRLEKLFSDGAATQKQVDDINGAVDLINAQITATSSQEQQVLAEIETMNIQVDQVKEKLSKCYISNPVDGTVLIKYAEAGEVAAPGKPLFKIADLSLMKLKVYVSGDQLPHIKIGQKVEVQIDKTKKENSSLGGTISWISSTAEFTPKTIQTKEERVTLVYAVKILVPNDGSMKIGMPGEVNF